MAVTHSLVLVFRDSLGSETTISYAEIDEDVATVHVSALCNAIVSNSTALLKIPLVATVSATLRSVTTTPYTLS